MMTEHMLQERITQNFNSHSPRPISDAEAAVIRVWYDAASAKQTEALGGHLAAVQNGLASQAGASKRGAMPGNNCWFWHRLDSAEASAAAEAAAPAEEAAAPARGFKRKPASDSARRRLRRLEAV